MAGMSDRIRMRRSELNLTLEEVGNKVGVGKSTVRKWETGEIENMRRDKIAALASALETSPAYLMGWEEPEEKVPTELEQAISQLNDTGKERLLEMARLLLMSDSYRKEEKKIK